MFTAMLNMVCLVVDLRTSFAIAKFTKLTGVFLFHFVLSV